MEKTVNENLIKVTEYNLLGKLPDPFIFDDGSRVTCPADWERRRKEIYKTAVELQYGTLPPTPEVFKVEPLYLGSDRRPCSYRITAGTRQKALSFLMKIFKPSTKERCPAVISGDMCFQYHFDPEYLNAFLDNGIHFVTFDRTELFPDIADYNVKHTVDGSAEKAMSSSVVSQFESGGRVGPLAEIYPDYTFGAIGAWAWGYSRCVDALEILGCADMDCIAFTGHSRGGKTAMLAGAVDERAAIVNPNATCAGACSCYRLKIKAITEDGKEEQSEMLSDLVTTFPSWLGPEMKGYVGRETELPFDSHYLKALVAPRALFVSEAASDIWANPVGSWQTTVAAGEVYKLLGAENRLAWYYRTGYHYQKVEDLIQLVSVIGNYRSGNPLNDKFFVTPFVKPELAFDWRAPEKENR